MSAWSEADREKLLDAMCAAREATSDVESSTDEPDGETERCLKAERRAWETLWLIITGDTATAEPIRRIMGGKEPRDESETEGPQ